jgi:hypothetical protein
MRSSFKPAARGPHRAVQPTWLGQCVRQGAIALAELGLSMNELFGKHKVSLGTGLFLGRHRQNKRDIVP